MENKNLQIKIKKAALYSIVILSVLVGVLFTQNYCSATVSKDSILEQANVNDSEMEQFIRQTRRRIKNNWYPPTSSFENSAILGITIDRKGNLVNCSLLQPSKDDGFNNSLLEAAKKTKYMPLPKDFVEDMADLSLEFGMQKHYVEKNDK